MPPIAGAVGTIGNIAGTVGSIGSSFGDLFGGSGQSEADERRNLYNKQLKRAQGYENQFMDINSKPPAELEQMQQDIKEGISPAQVEAMKAQNLALKKQGITGSQAAILKGRQSGEIAQDMQKSLNQNLYQDALRRQQAKSGYLQSMAQGLNSSLPY